MPEALALFPGMAAGHPGMASSLVVHPVGQEVFAEFSRASGIDVARLAAEADRDELQMDRHWELATLACELAAARSYVADGGGYDGALGFSIGAYVALASAGMIGIRQIVAMTDIVLEASRRLSGRYAMIAVLGLPHDTVMAMTKPGEVELAAVITPSHTLVAGEDAAVRRFAAQAAAIALKVTWLDVRWPLHTSLMRSVSDALAAGRGVVGELGPLRHPVYSLHHCGAIGRPELGWELLVEHLCHPLRLDLALAEACHDGVRRCVELGPGTTLSRAVGWLTRGELSCQAPWSHPDPRAREAAC
ncbi:MAG: ACP S-malonyltransferase [Acidobacteriota bacterium]